jgi:tRNA threonylcarbamoyl adenosine modification protein YeaZ
MIILALELSSGQGSIAWIEDDREPSVRTFSNDRKHSGLFFENLQRSVGEFGAPDVIVVGLGPGSYAGVRIAIATAVGLRAASAAKLIGIASICGMGTTAREYCVIGDARRASFFFGRVCDGRLIDGPSLHSLEELENMISESSVPVYASELLPQFPTATLAYPSAKKLAEVARDQASEIAETQSLEPIYLREPHITVAKTSRVSALSS